jgi:GNAT superfamily N-acetyltransferase
MIRRCDATELDEVRSVINDAADAYRGVIAADRWKDPYMSAEELRHEVDAGVVFWGVFEAGRLVGVMGLQHVADVALIRHAYTRSASQGTGIGTALLAHLAAQTDRPILVGTWSAATWAIRFYQRHGFTLVTGPRKDALLKRYWTISQRQIEDSVVLADVRWFISSSIASDPRDTK